MNQSMRVVSVAAPLRQQVVDGLRRAITGGTFAAGPAPDRAGPVRAVRRQIAGLALAMPKYPSLGRQA